MLILRGLNGPADRIEFAPDGGSLLGSSQEKPFRAALWELPTGVVRRSWPGVREAAFCPDGARLLLVHATDSGEPDDPDEWVPAGDRESWLRVFDPAGGEPQPPIAGGFRPAPPYVYGEDEEARFFRRPLFAPGGTRLAVIADPPGIRWLSWPAAEALAWPTPEPPGCDPAAVAFSPDGAALAVFDRQGYMLMFDALTGDLRWEHEIYSSFGPHVAFSPDGRWVAASSGSAMRVFAADNGERVAKVDHLPVFTGLAFTPDGRLLASSHPDGRVHFLNCQTWRHGPSFDWRAGGLRSLAFSKDGMLAAAGTREAVVVWDLDV